LFVFSFFFFNFLSSRSSVIVFPHLLFPEIVWLLYRVTQQYTLTTCSENEKKPNKSNEFFCFTIFLISTLAIIPDELHLYNNHCLQVVRAKSRNEIYFYIIQQTEM
jgi:hypothetical protein